MTLIKYGTEKGRPKPPLIRLYVISPEDLPQTVRTKDPDPALSFPPNQVLIAEQTELSAHRFRLKSYAACRKYSGSSGSSSSSSFDPDDHDIEAYYDDNRDEYDSYEDAYEGFLDDESSWDDY